MPSSLDEVVEAFLGLYTKEGLPRWRELFLPAFTCSATNPDGSVSSWNLEQFYERQHGLFASGKPISEVMMNTETQVTGGIACVRSDYVWTDGTAKKPGRLMMLLIQEQGRFRIQSLTFSYLD